MPKKSKKGSKKSAKGSKGAKDDAPKKKKGPTRCGPDFTWEKRPLLVEAAMAGDVVRCKKLIARGENVEDALHYAVGRGRLDVVNVFVESGANLHVAAKDGDYWNPPPPPAKAEKKSGKGKKKSGKGKKKKK
eukprot:m.48043 g.48043  ORF g.48043 m.48043 type:complete len:132 (-) comp20649_c0_seq1:734-1129(-)